MVLFAHGSRDPLWRLPIEAVATRVRQLEPGTPVRCAYLELTEPDLPTVAAELAALGMASLSVVPLFLGVGRHARDDLPQLVQALRMRHPGIAFELKPSIGEDPQLIDTIAQIALRP